MRNSRYALRQSSPTPPDFSVKPRRYGRDVAAKTKPGSQEGLANTGLLFSLWFLLHSGFRLRSMVGHSLTFTLWSILLVLVITQSMSWSAVELQLISPEQFRAYASLLMDTMRYSELLGISEGKAYIAVHELSSLGSKKWSKTVYWIEREKRDPKLLQQLAKRKQ